MSVTDTNYAAGGKIKSGNVTDAESACAHTVNNGNTPGGRSLEELESNLRGLLVAKSADRNDPAEIAKREARMRHFYAAKDGGMCGKCGRDLRPGEPVYVSCVWAGYSVFVGAFTRRYAPVCEGCAPRSMKRAGDPYGFTRYVAESCDTCGRLVTFEATGRDRYRRHVFCSGRCRWTYYNTARNERNARRREKDCEVCGVRFTAQRQDAKTCSAACKQKAYRQRAKGGAP